MSTTTTRLASASSSAQLHLSTSLEAKVVVLGSQNVGKTSLVHRYVHSNFLPGSMTPSTVGASFLTTRVHDPETDTTMRLQIWDTAGQERFRSISKLYYRGAHAAVLCYDITSRKSFEDMGVWLRELRDKGNAGDDTTQTILHIVGTKSDIVALDPSRREVPFERCIDFVTSELYPLSTPAFPALGKSAPSRPGSSYDVTHTVLECSPPSHAYSVAIQQQQRQQQRQQRQLVRSPTSERSSGALWGAPDQVWDCCHEISAKDGEGIDEVFRVITRKLIEQHHERERRHAFLVARNGPPSLNWGLASSGSMLGPGPHGQMAGGYFDARPGSGAAAARPGGSFRLGHGNNRKSWLGLYGGGSGTGTAGAGSLATTPGFPGLSAEEEARLTVLEQRRGKCC